MEQLAALVLNGDGRKLIGLTSDQPEIQAFLDNVPAYMVYIVKTLYIYVNLGMLLLILFLFRIKFVEFIWQPEKVAYEIYNQLWIVVNLLWLKMIYRRMAPLRCM